MKKYIFSLLTFALLFVCFGHGDVSASVMSGYNNLPTTLPNPTTNGVGSGQKYINITDGSQSSTGSGANHPNASFKVYASSLNGQAHKVWVTFYNNDTSSGALGNTAVSCDGYTNEGVWWRIFKTYSDESTNFTQLLAGKFDLHYRYSNSTSCGPGYSTTFELDIPDSYFQASGLSEHSGLFIAEIQLVVPTVSSPLPHSYFMTIDSGSSIVNPNQDTRLGYFQDAPSGNVIYPSRQSVSTAGDNNIDMPFRPRCSTDGGGPIVYGDDDEGFANQPPGWPTPPSGPGMSIHLLVYSPSGVNDITIANEGSSPGPSMFSGGAVDGKTFNYPWKSNEKYILQFRHVRGGNGIWVRQPFDTGSFDFDCPPQPIVKLGVDNNVCGQTDVGGWAIGPNGEVVGIDAYFDGPPGVGQQFLFGAPANGARGDVWNGHGFTFSVPPGLKDGNGHQIYIYALDPSGGGNNTGPGTPITFGPDPTTVSGCYFKTDASTSLTLSGGIEDPTAYSTNSTVTVTNQTDPGFNPSISMTCNITATKNGGQIGSQGCAQGFVANAIAKPISGPSGPLSGATAGDQFCSHIAVQYATGYVYRDGTVAATTGPKTADSGCPRVVNEPYVKVYGTSIAAGGNFKSTGSCTGGGLLAGWANYDSATGYTFGSGGELSALALVKIVGYASAQTVPTRSPDELSFANTPTALSSSIDSPTTGGNYDNGGANCLSDITPTTNAPADYTQAALTVNAGTNTSLYVDGDAYISDKVVYNTSGWAVGSVPSYALKAKGNIYIDNDVTQLDGIYEAGDKIYTCAYGLRSLVTGSSTFTDCRKQLVVHGSFIAKQVNLMRTYGSLRDEKPTPGSQAAGLLWYCGGNTCKKPAGASVVCTSANEPWDPNTWNDNELCLPTGSPYHIKFSYISLADAKNYGGGITLTNCTNAWGSVVNPAGVPSTGAGPPTGNNRGWDNNYFCSDFPGAPITFQKGPDAARDCTHTYEPADSEGGNIWQNVYICVDKPSPPQSPAAKTLANQCSNPNFVDPKRLTCAAEVFDFSPEIYLSDPALKPPSNGALQYDSITSLPPVL